MIVELEDEEEVEIPLLPHQLEAWEADEDEVCLCTGLGGGKTAYGAIWTISRAIAYPDSVHLATANTHSQLEDVVVPKLEWAADLLEIPHHYHHSRKILFLDLGDCEAQVWCRGLENPQKALRGPEFGSWWGDEVRDYAKKAIAVVDGRIRCTKVLRRKKLWTTTPNGFDHIHERFVEKAEKGIHRMIRAASTANRHLPQDYFETLRRNYDEFMLKQEMGGEFLNLAGGNLYYSFDRRVHVAERVQFMPNAPLILCWDQNANPMTCVVVQETRMETWAIDEVVIPHGNIPLACEKLQETYEEHTAGIILCGDAMGTNESASTGKSDYEVMRKELSRWYKGRIVDDVPRSNPPIVDRINAVNNRLKNAEGEISLYLNPRCRHLRLDFEQVQPKKGVRAPDGKKDPDRTHASDAIGYWIVRKHGISAFRNELEALKRLSR